MVIWIAGLSGAGKSTVGKLVWEFLRSRTPSVVLLDGDELRAVFGGAIGHDPEARRQQSVRIGNLCRLLDRQQIHVVCCAVTIAPEVQESCRQELSGYLEVFLDVSLEVLRERDPKHIYARAARGEIRNVAGVDIPYEPPRRPHLVIENNAVRNDLSDLARRILGASGLSG
jgi:adenylylsulfate kinase-like enzyme